MENIFNNVNTILHLLMVIPAWSAAVETVNSDLRSVET